MAGGDPARASERLRARLLRLALFALPMAIAGSALTATAARAVRRGVVAAGTA